MSPPYFVTSPNPPSTEPGTVLFETERLVVRRPRLADATAIAAAANFASVAASLRDRFPYPYTPADAEDFMRKMAPAADGSAAFPRNALVCLKPGGENNNNKAHPEKEETVVIGGIGFEHSTDVCFRSWEIGYWLTPAVMRRGYGLEVVRAAVTWAFVTWPGLNRIEATTYETNVASHGLLLKAGFTVEGVRRGAIFKNGRILHETILGIVRSDLGMDG